MSDQIFLLSDQNGALVGHMSFKGKKIYICSPGLEFSDCITTLDTRLVWDQASWWGMVQKKKNGKTESKPGGTGKRRCGSAAPSIP